MLPVFWGLALWQSTQRHLLFVRCIFTLKCSTNKDYFNKIIARTGTEQTVEKVFVQLRGLNKMCALYNISAIGKGR